MIKSPLAVVVVSTRASEPTGRAVLDFWEALCKILLEALDELSEDNKNIFQILFTAQASIFTLFLHSTNLTAAA